MSSRVAKTQFWSWLQEQYNNIVKLRSIGLLAYLGNIKYCCNGVTSNSFVVQVATGFYMLSKDVIGERNESANFQ